jgi:hypothetical protein
LEGLQAVAGRAVNHVIGAGILQTSVIIGVLLKVAKLV